jgi:eukaryotic-like serine/threonine-protein kinase
MRLFDSPKKRSQESSIVPLQSTTRAAPKSFVPRTYLGKYTTVKPLGEGSNATVFLARVNRQPQQYVVVKRIKDSASSAPRFRQFFSAEVRSMAKLRHPYIVQLVDASVDDPLGACLVLEYIPGITLEAALHRETVMAPDRVGRFLGPLGHALYAAQLAGVAHRDLKPANLMITGYGTDDECLSVMDFGFAGFTSKPHIQLAELTGEGQRFACGTPAYVSPEMVRGDSTDTRADIYSVGVILFELLTGRLPFEFDDQAKLLDAHVRRDPPTFKQLGYGHLPPGVEETVRTAMCKYPSERQQTMKDLVDQFSKAVGWNIWELTAPKTNEKKIGFGSMFDVTKASGDDTKEAIAAKTGEMTSPFILSDVFEATLPEKLAALKLRGFIEDVQGQVIESEPGLIRVRVEMPSGYREQSPRAGGSGVFAFLSGVIRTIPSVPRGQEPIEIEMKMEKLSTDKVAVLVAFRPVSAFMPTDPKMWAERCEAYYGHLRKFIMPE